MAEGELAGHRYRVGIFEFDAESLELWKQGRRLRIRPQSLKLLKLLLAASGEPVPREQIQAELWGPDVFVDVEQGINHCIKELRRAFGDDATTPRYIETLPRRGYRFVAPFERVTTDRPVDAAAAPSKASEKGGIRLPTWVWGGLALATAALVIVVVFAATRDRRSPTSALQALSIAVLPFETRSVPATRQHAGIGMADALISSLASRPHVRVRPMAAVMPYQGRSIAIQDVGRMLGVEYVVQGLIEDTGDGQSVTLTVSRAVDGHAIWTGSLSGHADELQRLEQEAADHVVSALNATAPPTAGQRASGTPAAHEAYLEGRYYLARFSGPDTLLAVGAFERALASDATYARSHAGLATASAQMYIRFGSEPDIGTWKSRAEQHAARALQLDDHLAEAHEALAAVARYTEFDWEEVIEQSVEALRLNPSLDLPHYYIASALQHIGRLDLVEDQIVAGLDANPLNLAEAYRLRGVAALWSGRFHDARTHLEQVSRLTARGVADAHLAAAIYYGGDASAAEALLRSLKGSAQAEQRAAALLASLLAARGDRAGATALIDIVKSRTYLDHHVAYSLGAAYAGLGQEREAMSWLKESARTGFLCHGWYEQDPLLNPLRHGTGLTQLVAEMKSASDRIATLFLGQRTGLVQ